MKIQRVVAVMIGIVLPLLAAGAQAAELKVYASTAVKAVLQELGPQFEKATGNQLVFTFGPAAVMKKQIDEGAAFDVAILTPALTDGLATAGKIDPASRVAIARAGSGRGQKFDQRCRRVGILAGARHARHENQVRLKAGRKGSGKPDAGNEQNLAHRAQSDFNLAFGNPYRSRLVQQLDLRLHLIGDAKFGQ